MEFHQSIPSLLLYSHHAIPGVLLHCGTTLNNPRITPYQIFVANLFTLLLDLRRDKSASHRIHIGWARREIRSAAQKVYMLKTWRPEQLEDLIHTVVCQRPELLRIVIGMLRMQYGDETAARRWERFRPNSANTTRMGKHFDKIDVNQASSEEFLATPNGIAIFVVDTAEKLTFIDRDLDECLQKGGDKPCLVGLDAEWNPYTGRSKASIIQVALTNVVYIVDVDALASTPRLTALLNKVFSNERLLKIGQSKLFSPL